MTLPEQRRRQADLRRLLDHGNYVTQKQFLEKINEVNQEDVFVATYMLYATEPESSRTFSLSTWAQCAETSLPRTSRIALLRQKDNEMAGPLVVDWEQPMT